MRLLLVALLTALIVIAAPGSASAKACGVPQAKAVYETPDVQVYRTTGGRLMGCSRASGRAHQVGWDYTDGIGTYETGAVVDILGGRWVWVSQQATAAESADHSEYWFTDLSTGKLIVVVTQDEDEPVFQAVGMAGVIAVAGQDGVLALHPDGRIERLGGTPAAFGIAAAGNRVYWQDAKGVAQTATVALPTPATPLAPPRARTIGRCKPRPGARLLLRDGDSVHTQAGGRTWRCVKGRTRAVAPTPPADPTRATVGAPDPYTYWLDAAGAAHVADGVN